MKIIIKIIIIITFIYLIGIYFHKRKYYKNRVPDNIMKYFDEEFFLNQVSDFPVTYLEYNGNNLDPEKYVNSTIEDFLKKDNNKQKRYQIKQTFEDDNLSRYFYNYAYFPLIEHLKLKNTSPFVIRVSKSEWSFDYHYDCMDLLLVQLSGTRIVYLKKDKNSNQSRKYVLNSGDMLHIPIGMYHRVETGTGLNVNFNIILETKDTKKIDKCKKQFNIDYKLQSQKCKNNKCI